jgi:predicted ABC-class ATPase
MKNVLATLAVIGIIVLSFFVGRQTAPIKSVEVEKVIYDTITHVKVRVDTVFQTKVVERYVRVVDTVKISHVDSILVEIPINSYTFEEKGLYRAEISGYEVSLDKMTVYPKTIIQTQQVPDTRRWGLGVSVGYGVSDKGLTPYIGVGITYNFLTW